MERFKVCQTYNMWKVESNASHNKNKKNKKKEQIALRNQEDRGCSMELLLNTECTYFQYLFRTFLIK